MLLAQPVRHCEWHVGCGQGTQGKEQRDTKTLEFTRLLPLKFVKISIHKREKQQLPVKLATGCSYYLQLCAPPDKQEKLFGYWEVLIHLLRPPVEAYSSTHAVPAGDRFMSMLKEMDSRSPNAAHFPGTGGQGEVSTGSIHVLEVTAALSAASAAGERARQDFHKGMTVTKSASEQLNTALAGAATEWPGGRTTNATVFPGRQQVPSRVHCQWVRGTLPGGQREDGDCRSSTCEQHLPATSAEKELECQLLRLPLRPCGGSRLGGSRACLLAALRPPQGEGRARRRALSRAPHPAPPPQLWGSGLFGGEDGGPALRARLSRGTKGFVTVTGHTLRWVWQDGPVLCGAVGCLGRRVAAHPEGSAEAWNKGVCDSDRS
ncbi:Protein FAM71A [Manis javanica]|nr:Protein FAM71A [Manis javanica]